MLATRGSDLTGLEGGKVIELADLAVSNTRESLFASLSERDSDRTGHGAALSELRRQIAAQTADTDAQVEQAATLADLLRDLRVA